MELCFLLFLFLFFLLIESVFVFLWGRGEGGLRLMSLSTGLFLQSGSVSDILSHD